jgi:hypothetical protein
VTRLWSSLALLVSLAALVIAGLAWRSAHSLQSMAPDALQTVAALLVERDATLRVLQAPPYAEGDHGLLESYLIRLRRDGAVKSADMKQRIDRLAEITTAVEVLLDLSAADSQSPGFKAEAARFRAYAIAWRGRWNSVTELFMTGGNLPAAELPFPEALLAAVQAEQRASR